jgi:hypothetical protein
VGFAVSKIGVTAAAVGAHLRLTRQRVGQLTDEGVFSRLADGSFDLDACRFAYIEWLRSDDRRSAKSVVASRINDARAAEIEIRTAERLKTLQGLGRDEGLAVVDAVLGPMRSDLQSVPARVTKDLALRLRLESELNGVLDNAANRARTHRRDRPQGGPAVADAAAVKPGPMGKKQPGLSAKRGRARAA